MGNENHITYQNVTITGNAIVGGMYHGIMLDQTDNANLSNNFVEGYQDQNSWIMLNNSTHSTEANNIATTFQGVGNIGLVETNDVQIAQGPVGDTALVATFQVTHTTADLQVVGTLSSSPVVPSPQIVPTPPTMDEPAVTGPMDAQILDAINANISRMFSGGWML
jgi:hypothetical protein